MVKQTVDVGLESVQIQTIYQFRLQVVQLNFGKVFGSDESELSWLEPELELKEIQLGSARLVTFSPSARNQKLAQNEPKF